MRENKWGYSENYRQYREKLIPGSLNYYEIFAVAEKKVGLCED